MVSEDSTAAPAEPLSSHIGRSESFDAFYGREMPRLVVLARALGGGAVAEDIAQEALLVAYRRWDEVSQFDRPQMWVGRVCANLATSYLRRRTIEAKSLLRLAGRRTFPAMLPEHETFWAHVRALPRRQAQAVALRYIYDLSVAEVAAAMGCSEGAAKVHLSRGREGLARRLGADFQEDRS